MEQYFLPSALDFKNLRTCLDNYTAERLYIRDCGGYNPDGTYRMQGLPKVDETLEDRMLDFRWEESGLYFLIDHKKVFHFEGKELGTREGMGFTVAYEREDEEGHHILLPRGINPYDLKLPEPKRSVLRHIIDHHLIEITFKGRIFLTFHSWLEEPHWKYWTVAANKSTKR